MTFAYLRARVPACTSVAAILVSVALTAACGDGDSTAGSDPSATAATSAPASEQPFQLPADQWPDACDMLTAADPAAVFGIDVGAAEPGGAITLDDGTQTGGAGTCTSSSADGVEVELEVRNVVYPVQDYFTQLRFQAPNAVVVEGVGDDAFDPGAPTPTIVACQGYIVYVATVSGGDDAVVQEQLTAFAAAAADSLTGEAAEGPA